MKKHTKTTLGVVPKDPKPVPPTLLIKADEGIGGNETEDLLCGGCRSYVAIGVRPQTFHAKFPNMRQIVIECNVCGAHNEVPKA